MIKVEGHRLRPLRGTRTSTRCSSFLEGLRPRHRERRTRRTSALRARDRHRTRGCTRRSAARPASAPSPSKRRPRRTSIGRPPGSRAPRQIEKLDAPGGGRASFASPTPNGYTVEIVHGREQTRGASGDRGASPLNRGSDQPAPGNAPAACPRPDPPASSDIGTRRAARERLPPRASEWYQSRFGFLSLGRGLPGRRRRTSSRPSCAATCGRRLLSDHHTFLCVGHRRAVGFDHAAFEVEDIDAVMAGHDHLEGKPATTTTRASADTFSAVPGVRLLEAIRGATCSSTSPTATC